MARTQIKLLIFLITVGLVAGTLAMGYWVYMNILLKESQVESDIAAMKGKDRPRIDPGVRRFEAAVDLIRAGKIDEGRDALYKLRQQFPDSGTCDEAMRIIGEINLDQLYSPNHPAGKKDYIVQPGNSLLGIAIKHDTTIDSIIRTNGLMSTMLQPGDHLMIIPMDFHLGITMSKKQVLLLRKVGDKSYPFKMYHASDIRLPPGTRIPVEMQIAGKNAIYDGKNVPSTDSHYLEAEKWMSVSKPGSSQPGLIIRTPPVAKAIPVDNAPPPPGTAAPQPTVAETGIFLSREDIEELVALLRVKSKVSLVR